MEALLAEAHSHSSTEEIKRQPPPASPPLHAPTPATPQPRPATSLHCKLRRHTWLLAEDFGAAPSTGPLLRGFTAPMHMARRARHGEATKAWRHSSLKIELSRNARVDDTCWRRPGDAMAWRSAACAYACEKAHSRGRRSRFELRPLSSATRPLLATPNPPRAAHAGPPSICTRSITNFLGSSLEGYHLLTPLMPIEEENSCLAKCWPGSGGEDRAGHHAGPIGDEELAKGKPRQVTPSAARACLRRSLPAPALAPPSPRPRPALPRPATRRASRCTRIPYPLPPYTQVPLQGASSFFGDGSNSFAIDWSLAANLPWPTLDDVAWEAAADAKLRAVGDACCTFSFPDFSDVSHAFPSLASLWEPEGLL